MQNIPKTVLKRIHAAAPGAHPDADLLTAFAEQSLLESERTPVSEHLARCGDCREIVALAVPSLEDAALPLREASERRYWFSWPVLRWGVVAAGIALAAVGFVQYRHSQQPAVVSKLEVSENSAITAAPAPSSAPANLRSQAVPATINSRNEVRPTLPKTKVQANSGGGFGGGMGPRIAGRSAEVVTKKAPAAPSETLEAQSAAAQAATGEAVQSQSQLASNGSAAQGQLLAKLDSVAKAKAPVPAQSTTAPAPAFAPPAMPLQTSPALMMHASPRWTVTANGGLQRSFDGGQSWEDVNVAAALTNAPRHWIAGETEEPNKNQEQSAKTALKKKSANLVFRTVSAMGPEVWAGGLNAVLYHSPDSGVHWTQVLPAENGAALTGDITAIEFSDPQNGRIVTSVPEFWSTANGGLTWHKEQ